LAIVHCYAGQFDQAEAKFRKDQELKPDNQFLLPWLAKCHLLKGEPEKALSVARQIALESRRLWIMPMAYHDLGQKQAADEALGILKENHADEAASFIAENHAWRGEIDKAFEWLDRAIDEKQYMWGSLVFDPAFRNLHDDPRWATIRERDGRSEEQLSKIEF
jgi:tetratricopeptide (TPR) repeat protein